MVTGAYCSPRRAVAHRWLARRPTWTAQGPALGARGFRCDQRSSCSSPPVVSSSACAPLWRGRRPWPVTASLVFQPTTKACGRAMTVMVVIGMSGLRSARSCRQRAGQFVELAAAHQCADAVIAWFGVRRGSRPTRPPTCLALDSPGAPPQCPGTRGRELPYERVGTAGSLGRRSGRRPRPRRTQWFIQRSAPRPTRCWTSASSAGAPCEATPPTRRQHRDDRHLRAGPHFQYATAGTMRVSFITAFIHHARGHAAAEQAPSTWAIA
jgi:hypothetical protein